MRDKTSRLVCVHDRKTRQRNIRLFERVCSSNTKGKPDRELSRDNNLEFMEKERPKTQGEQNGGRENKLRRKPTDSVNIQGVGKQP